MSTPFDPVVDPAPEAPAKPVPSPVRLRCTFCHDALAREAAAYCAACLAPHHATCFREHARCAAPGCEHARALRPARPRWLGRVAAAAALVALGAGLTLAARRAPPAPATAMPTWPSVANAALAGPTTVPPPGASAPTACGPLAVTAEADRAYALAGEPFHAVVTLTGGPAPEGAARAPARVALVVDRSGSMSRDDKIGFARQAVGAFLAGLGPQDQVTVLSFDSAVETVIPWTPGGEVGPEDPRLRLIFARGGTRIGEALRAAEATLREAAREGEAKRIVLLTDGRDEQPDALPGLVERLRDAGVTLSCHGFGEDVDGPLLGRLAELGGGRFFFVDSGARAVHAFEAERDLALATVARDVAVRLEPAPGLVIERVIAWEVAEDGPARTVHVGDVTAAAERKVVVRLRIPGGGDASAFPLRVTCRAATPEGARFEARLEAACSLTTDVAQAQASLRPHLAARLAQARFADEMGGVQGLLAQGDRAGARAAARAAYERLAECPEAVAAVRTQSYVASDAAARFFSSGDLDAEAAECLIPSGCLPVGK